MRTLFAALLTLTLAAAAAAQEGRAPAPQDSARLQDRPDVTTRPLPAAPDKSVVLIFNHGTNRPQFRHPCDENRDVPGVVRDVATVHGWLVHAFCSAAVDGNEPASYTYKRADEILALVAAYRAKGVPASNIFLLGQSAGAWSSLMAARKDHSGFNAVIGFAPAFAGTRAEEAQYPRWRGEYRVKQIAYLREARRIEALIVGYYDDTYDRPEDLKPLESIPGIRILAFDACHAGHGTAYSECFRAGARVEIEDYIRQRLAKP